MYLKHSSELIHHGIKGQKWGVRRFQNRDGSLTIAGRARYNEHETYDPASGDPEEYRMWRKHEEQYNNTYGIKKEKRKATAFSVANLALGFIPAAVVAVKNSFKKHDDYNYNDVSRNDRLNHADFKKKDDSLSAENEETIRKVASSINPLKGSLNCYACSVGYDLKRRGYNIVAPVTDEGTCTRDMMKKSYKDFNIKQEHNLKWLKSGAKGSEKVSALSKELFTNGGKRGVIAIKWSTYSGHAIAYEKIGGKIHYIDSQSNGVLSPKELNTFFDYVRSDCICYTRTDNLTPNYEALAKVYGKDDGAWKSKKLSS